MVQPNIKLKDIKIGVDGDKPETLGILSRNKNVEYFQAKPEKREKEKIVKPGRLISRLEVPKIIKYGKDEIRLSPRARQKVADIDKVGKLPIGVILIPIRK